MVKVPSNIWIVVALLFVTLQKAIAQDTVVINNKEIISNDSIGGIVSEDDLIASNETEGKIITVQSDSARQNSIDAPVYLTAKDSMIMITEGGNTLYIYGEGSAKYKEDVLNAEYISMNADNNTLYATFGIDSLGTKIGFPVFKSKDQEAETEMEELNYNIKTKKMFIRNVRTKQGEGFITAGVAKKMPDDSFYMLNAKYTTCDNTECPHFYFNLTRAKFQAGKNTVTGPAYLVIEDVPLPLAIPFGFFPASKSYSSGILMPTYGDEMARGFSLRDGGYYFAFNDYIDMELRGEIYTKGSWGVSARSSYTKLYKYSGGFNASYLVTVLGDKDTKDLPNTDYSKSRDIKLTWNHRQDPKSNPYGTFTANVNFSTSSYNRNNFRESTLSQMSENTKASSVSYSYKSPSPSLPLTINSSFSVNQQSRDSTLSVSLPDMTISINSIYPFKRKEQIGSERWYEKIYLSYSGTLKNNINNVKEYDFLKKSLIKDWRNGMKHAIPVSASFNLFKHITVSTQVNYNENWYTNRFDYRYNREKNDIIPADTLYGFFRTYDYGGSISLNTKLYGMFKPWDLLGKWTKGVQIRHVLTPTVSFSGAPNFSDPKYGMFKDIKYIDNSLKMKNVRYPLYNNHLFGGPSSGRTGAINFSLDNNLEAKIPIAGTDSTRKVSLIDNFGMRMSYNFLADSMNWSNLNANIRFKLFNSSINLSGNFDTYLYDENGHSINTPRWKKAGKGIGRFTGTSTSYNYTINNEALKKIFRKGEKDTEKNDKNDPSTSQEGISGQMEGEENRNTRQSLFNSKKQEGDYDPDGYLLFTIPWNLTLNYSINLAYDRQNFNKIKREYPYKISQTLGFSGDISPTKAWRFTFGGSYDFDTKSIANMFCSISRQMHCWSMSASIVPIGPFQNYSFSIAVNSTLLQDFKYQQSSNYRDAINWGNR